MGGKTQIIKSALQWIQDSLPGVKRIRGADPIPGKPGMYDVDPSKLSDAEWLRRAEKQQQNEYDIATRGPNKDRDFSTRAHNQAMPSAMLLGALNELRYAAMRGTPHGTKEAIKGVVAVDKGGNVRGGAAINRTKAREYLEDKYDLDFTRPDPNYLEYVATTSPDFKGSDILREIQKLYGDDMVFQVASPKKNVPVYEAMGAQRMGLGPGGVDVLDGGPGLPAFRIEKRIPERGPKRLTAEDLEEMGQQRIPGFAGGGKVGMDHGVRQKEWGESGKAVRGGLESLGNFAYDMIVPQSPLDVGLMLVGGPFGRTIKKVGAALVAGEASDAEASPLSKALKHVKQMPFYKDIPLDNGETAAMFVNPSDSELARLMNISRRVAKIEGGQPAVRLLRDRRNVDIYAADGNKVLHSDMAGHVPGLKAERPNTDIWFEEEPQERAMGFLRSLPIEKASGGIVQSTPQRTGWDILAE